MDRSTSPAREPNLYVLEEQIKQLQRDMKDGFGRIESQMEALLRFHKEELKDHEERIRKLEQDYWKWVGIASAAAFVLSIAGTLLVRLIS